MKNIARKVFSLIMAAVMLSTLAVNLAVVGSAAPTSFTKVNYLQSDTRWRYLSYNNSYMQASGCGILSIVNAIYNCTGNFIEPKTAELRPNSCDSWIRSYCNGSADFISITDHSSEFMDFKMLTICRNAFLSVHYRAFAV